MVDPAPLTNNAITPPAGPDPEVTAIGRVNEALVGLDPEVQKRVLRWAADRFDVTLRSSGRAGDSADAQDEEERAEETETNSEFADIASLYDAANPSTEGDKALVVAYWLQVIQGNADWTGFSVNKELNNLGHGVKNITVALGSLIDSMPRLVIQTYKAGKTKQARKKYKVTNEGIKRVKQMLAGSGGQE